MPPDPEDLKSKVPWYHEKLEKIDPTTRKLLEERGIPSDAVLDHVQTIVKTLLPLISHYTNPLLPARQSLEHLSLSLHWHVQLYTSPPDQPPIIYLQHPSQPPIRRHTPRPRLWFFC